MSKTKLTVHPYVRLTAAILAITGSVIAKDMYQLLIGWLFLIVPFVIITGTIKKHLSFLLYAILPIVIMLLFVYAFILPNFQNGKNIYSTITGVEFALTTVLKLILFTSVLQLVLHIPNEELFTTLKCWGIKGDGLVIYFGALTIWADVKMKANKIIDARFARGLVKSRSVLNRLKQVPYVIRPLITGILLSSLERSQSWKQKKILLRLENLKGDDLKYSFGFNLLLLLICLLWIIMSIYIKYK